MHSTTAWSMVQKARASHPPCASRSRIPRRCRSGFSPTSGHHNDLGGQMARTSVQAVIALLLVAVGGCGRAPDQASTAAEPQKAGSSTLESTDALVSKAQTVDPETLPGAPL